MTDYFYLDDPESEMGMAPVPSEEMVAASDGLTRFTAVYKKPRTQTYGVG